jgi:hypothetical protein
MQRRIISLIACLALATLAVVPARANGTTQGRIVSVGLHGFTDELFVGQFLTGAITVGLTDDGSTKRKLITVTTWVDTPLGRATISQELHRLAPGQEATYLVAIPYLRPIPGSQNGLPVTIGVTVAVKGETVEASHSLTIFSTPAPE